MGLFILGTVPYNTYHITKHILEYSAQDKEKKPQQKKDETMTLSLLLIENSARCHSAPQLCNAESQNLSPMQWNSALQKM